MCKSAVESVGLIVFSVLQYGPVKHGIMWNIPHLYCIPNFTLVMFNSSLVWQIKVNLISNKGG